MASLRSTWQSFSQVGYRASLSSYSTATIKKLNSAQDDIIDDAYKNGEITTEAYLSSLNDRLLRDYLTPLQRTNLTQKIRDVTIDAEDTKIRTAYETGSTYNGQTVDDSYLLKWEKLKLENMVPESEAYNQQLQTIANLEDRVNKQERSQYRAEKELAISEMPAERIETIQAKMSLYDDLINMANEDGDTEQVVALQTARNNLQTTYDTAVLNEQKVQELSQITQDSFNKIQQIKESENYKISNYISAQDIVDLNAEMKDQIDNGYRVEPWVQALDALFLQNENGDKREFVGVFDPAGAEKLDKAYSALSEKKRVIEEKGVELEKIQANIQSLQALADQAGSLGLIDKQNALLETIRNEENSLLRETVARDTSISEFDSKVEDFNSLYEQTTTNSAKKYLNEISSGLNLVFDRMSADFSDSQLMAGGINDKYQIDTSTESTKSAYIKDLAQYYTSQRVAKESLLEIAKKQSDTTAVSNLSDDIVKLGEKESEYKNYAEHPELSDFFSNVETGSVDFKPVDRTLLNPMGDGTRPIDLLTVPLGQAGVRYDTNWIRSDTGEAMSAEAVLQNHSELIDEYNKGNLNLVVDIKLNPTANVVRDIPLTFQDNGNGGVILVPDKSKLAPWENRSDKPNFVQNLVSSAVEGIKTATGIKKIELFNDTGSATFNKLASKNVVNSVSRLAGINSNSANALTIREVFTPGGTTRKLSEEENNQFRQEMLDRFGIDIAPKKAEQAQPQQPQVQQQQTSNLNVPEEYKQLITDTANKYGLRPEFLASVIRHESNFDPNAINTANANGTYDRGLAQLNSQYYPDDSIAYDPAQAIDMAGQILKQGFDATGSEEGALGAYNRGISGYLSDPASAQQYIDMVRSKEPLVTFQGQPQQSMQTSYDPSVGLVNTTPISLDKSQNPIMRSVYAQTPDASVSPSRVGIPGISAVSSPISSGLKKIDSTIRSVNNTLTGSSYNPSSYDRPTLSFGANLPDFGLFDDLVNRYTTPGKVKDTRDTGFTEYLDEKFGIKSTPGKINIGTPGGAFNLPDFGLTEKANDYYNQATGTLKKKANDIFGSIRSLF